MSQQIYKTVFKQDYALYEDVLNRYIGLASENGELAYELHIEALAVADRFTDIGTEIDKVKESVNVTKSEFKEWAYSKYRIMREIHTSCRMIWKECENARYRGES